jgi:hypothetical protein
MACLELDDELPLDWELELDLLDWELRESLPEDLLLDDCPAEELLPELLDPDDLLAEELLAELGDPAPADELYETRHWGAFARIRTE